MQNSGCYDNQMKKILVKTTDRFENDLETKGPYDELLSRSLD